MSVAQYSYNDLSVTITNKMKHMRFVYTVGERISVQYTSGMLDIQTT